MQPQEGACAIYQKEHAYVNKDQTEAIITAIIFAGSLISWPNQQGGRLDYARDMVKKICDQFTDL